MQEITADSTIEEVMRRIGVGAGESLHESERRRRNLEKFAQLKSRNPNTKLSLEEVPTAFVTTEDGEFDDEFIRITITTREFSQEVDQLPPEYHNFLVQKAMTIHEAAHIMYSSYPDLKKYLDKVEDEGEEVDVQMFQNVFNLLEDGAIENFASNDFSVGKELTYLRATIHENDYFGQQVEKKSGTEYHYPMYYAIMAALLNIAVYDNGELSNLLDKDNETHIVAVAAPEHDRDMLVEVMPKLREYAEKIQHERNAKDRAALIYDLWEIIKKYIDRSTTPGKNRMQKNQSRQDGDGYAPGVPNNLSEDHGEQKEIPGDPGGNEEGGDGENKKTIADKRNDADSKAEEMKQEGKKGVVGEGEEEAGDWSDEIEKIIDALEGGSGEDEIFIPEDGNVDIARKEEAERMGRRCAKLFRNRLRQMQKDRERKGKLRGKFDSRKLINASRGSPRAFKQIEEGDDRDYSCMIVCDRSGSMTDLIGHVELSAGAVAYGLENVGVETCIMDTHNGKTALTKPFQTDVDSFDKKLFAGRSGGGTPLSSTVSFARERMKRSKNNYPFMIIITDGRPHSRKRFKEEVRKANFPVIGIYITDKDESEQLRLYDRAVTVSRDEDVSQKLTHLINSVAF